MSNLCWQISAYNIWRQKKIIYLFLFTFYKHLHHDNIIYRQLQNIKWTHDNIIFIFNHFLHINKLLRIGTGQIFKTKTKPEKSKHPLHTNLFLSKKN